MTVCYHTSYHVRRSVTDCCCPLSMNVEEAKRLLNSSLHVPDITSMILLNYLCDVLDYFSMPPNWQLHIERLYVEDHCDDLVEFTTLFGKLHGLKDRPARVCVDPTYIHRDEFICEWYKSGVRYRGSGKPTTIQKSGKKQWWTFNVEENLYHIKCDDGTLLWQRDDQWLELWLHRDNDLPAVIRPDGTKEWWSRGERHRDNNLPAILHVNGDGEYYQHGYKHRDNNPAVSVHIDDQLLEQWWQRGDLVREIRRLPSNLVQEQWWDKGTLVKEFVY